MLRAATRAIFSSEKIDLLILEMGLRRAGDASRLLRVLVPDVLVVTPLTPSFSNDTDFLDVVEREVGTLARAVSGRGGTVIACADDPRLLAAVVGVPRLRTFTRDQASYAGRALVLERAGERFDVGLDVVGESSIYALLAGLELTDLFGAEPDLIRRFLRGGA
jgi:UDP-N-acetylmuramyl pentapeptide synthase